MKKDQEETPVRNAATIDDCKNTIEIGKIAILRINLL